MADVTHKRIDELDTISGILKGISLRRVGGDLGVSAFGISISEMEPGATAYPEHDHSPDGIGGKMFAKRPEQLGQEEVYVALRGSGTIVADGEELPLDGDHDRRRARPRLRHRRQPLADWAASPPPSRAPRPASAGPPRRS